MKNKILNILKDNTYCRLQPSPIHGIGVFAIKDIPDGVNPFSDSLFTDDILIKHEELEGLDGEVKDLVYALYMSDKNGVYFQVKDEQPVTPNRTDFNYYVNHSEDPNVRWFEDCYCYRTIKIVKKGKELFLNYNEYYEEV